MDINHIKNSNRKTFESNEFNVFVNFLTSAAGQQLECDNVVEPLMIAFRR